MRLGQIARKLALRPSEIVEFLLKQSVRIEDNANTRLEEDQVNLILQHFAPGELVPKIAEQPPADQQNDLADQNDLPEVEVQAISEEPDETVVRQESTIIPEIETTAPSLNETPDIIKAPKIELSGLKVLGKIDLPETRKKEVLAESSESAVPVEGERRPRQEVRRNNENRRSRNDQRSAKNPIAAQREREAEEAEEKRKELLEREKERKTQNYLRKVKMSPPTKAIKLVNEEVEEMIAEDLVEEPKTWFGKFIKWLST